MLKDLAGDKCRRPILACGILNFHEKVGEFLPDANAFNTCWVGSECERVILS